MSDPTPIDPLVMSDTVKVRLARASALPLDNKQLTVIVQLLVDCEQEANAEFDSNL